MRALWLTPEVPEFRGTGGGLRARHLLRGLAADGWGVTVVAPAHPAQVGGAEGLADGGIELLAARRADRAAEEVARALVKRPSLVGSALADPWLALQAEVFWTSLSPLVDRALAEGRFDLAVVEHDFCCAWAERLPPGLPVLLHAHNATWTILERRAASAGRARRMALRAEGARFRSRVRRVLPRYARVCTVSEPDARAFRAMGARRVEVVPNGVDAAAYARVPAGGGEPGSMIFTGNLGYAPNDEAIRWMAHDVLPRVRKSRPDATLTAVGRGASAALCRLAARTGIELAGWVDDLAPPMARAAVAVAPMRSGGGTNLKVFDALAASRALVTTPLGAEGTGLVAGRHALIEQDADAFAAAVLSLFADPGRRRSLGEAGRAFVAQSHDWAALARRFAAVLESTADS